MTDLVPLFRTLADETRIKILALLIDGPRSAEEVAAALALPSKGVQPHLWRLEQAGLAERDRSGPISRYRFRRQPLLNCLKAIAEPREGPELPGDLDAYDQKILGTFLSEEGKLKSIPTQQKKREVILRFLADKFETDRMYGEKEVNQILLAYHDDVASLRRYLIDSGLLERQVVRVVEAEALLLGTPRMEPQVMYWKSKASPAVGAESTEAS